MNQRDKQRKRCLEYYHKNKKAIHERVMLKRKMDRLKANVVVIPPVPQKSITKKEIMALIGIKALMMDKIIKDSKYCMPKHVATHIDGSILFNRAEIMDWLPYIREVCAFMYKRPPIKLTGMAAQIVQFMHRSKDMEMYCDELRRKQLDGRINNG
jgi:predicted DNA-binding transcriptional regulator AlpA